MDGAETSAGPGTATGSAVTGAGATTRPDTPQGARGRWWAVAAISVSVLVVGLDLTVLSLALPTISVDLHASTSSLQWITDAYSLVLAAMILPAGMLGDRFGRKRILIGALVLFGASSAACAYATSTGALITARVVLGIGAAAVFPLALSVIPVLFAPEERRRAITVISSATMISFPIGPIVGGYLLDHFWWGSVFLINVPIVVIAVIAVTILLPESKSEHKPRFDIPGILISCVGLVALTYGFIKVGENSWSDGTALATIGVGVVVLAAFVWWQRRTTGPLIDLKLFSSRGFTWGTILATLVSFAMFGLLFCLPQYFQDVKGVDAMGSGIRLLPMIGGMIVGMIGGARLQTPRGGRPPVLSPKVAITIGFLVMGAGIAIGATTGVSSGTGFAAAWIAITGAGLGVAMPSSMTIALGALTAERSGSGSALISALRQVGATVGTAILGSVLSNGYTSDLHLPGPLKAVASQSVAVGVEAAVKRGSVAMLDDVRTAFTHGMDIMLITCGGVALLSAILALAFLPRATATAATRPGSEP
jgi:MFS transporter, DHA2 family, multidrug resistance protein